MDLKGRISGAGLKPHEHLYKAVVSVLFHRILNNNQRKEPINPLHLFDTKHPLEARILQMFLLLKFPHHIRNCGIGISGESTLRYYFAQPFF